MNPLSFAGRALRALAPLLLCASVAQTAAAATATAIDLADSPLFSTVTVPGNLVLALSVEYPTANSSAYFSTAAYASSSTYLGYFDPAKCYYYNAINTGTSSKPDYSTSYFTPKVAASSHTCSSTSTLPLWSGNYLNWAGMQSLDIFRWVLTGGNRIVDTGTSGTTAGSTILQKTYHSGQDGGSDAPNKTLVLASETGATPFTWTKGVLSRTWGAGVQMWFTSTGTLTSAATSTTTTPYVAQNSYTSSPASNSTIYSVYMNVKVCDTTVSVESNCTLYGTTYKPEGLMQEYSSQLRYAAVGYLTDSNKLRDGGVLRARMNFVGPTKPVPGSSAIANPALEWDGTTGVMVTNPDSADAQATTSASTSAGYTVSITQSGVMNYLNKFGYAATTYKTYDPVSEMYYAAVRYLKNLANVPEYTSLASAGSTTTMNTWLDGFPVITNPTDPILYACQKNFILGIGDVNTNQDEDLYGSTIITSGSEPSTMPPLVAADTSVNVKTATDMVGTIEGVSNLGSAHPSGGNAASFFIAGLAYDSHTKDIRSDLDGTQTINTYWLDVLEYQTYTLNNQYYYATKYGGFTVPDNFSPYSSKNAKNTLATGATTTALTDSMWHTNSDLESTNKRPDNYFTANNADVMQSGLTAAFKKISSEAAAANSTSLATPSVNLTSNGTVSYGATYDPSNWTGEVIATSVVFNTDGSISSTGSTKQWDARDILSATSSTSATRKIVTCCTTNSSPGLQFTAAALAAGPLISRTYYTSFGAVPGVSTSSQSQSNYVLYLRGDTSQELTNGGDYRDRSYRLGDIVNAKPIAVGVPDSTFYDSTNPGYSAFKAAYASRKTVVYAGSNDGMLHAFDGSVGASTSGSELFAYIPSFVYGTSTTAATTGISTLGNPTFTHHYFVDSTPGDFDVNLNNTVGASSTTPDWRTLLIGGLGKGGTGYYALDVTNPTSWTSESVVATKVLWEFTDSRMGYTYGTPSVVKTKKYGWVVVMTSGYNNSDGVGYFFFVNPRTGALLEAVATPAGYGSTSVPLNMAQHSAYVPDYTDGTADAIYAGDLQGNVWRLDVTGTTGSYSSPTLIATLKDASNKAQPVTTRPLIENDTNSLARYLLVGTGRLLADSDISSGDVQTFYAIVDGLNTSGGFYKTGTLPTGVAFPITRAKLNPVTDLTVGINGTSSSSMGWYYDLPVTNTIAARVNGDPVANLGVVARAGNLPNGQACSPAGTGATYATALSTGKSVLTTTTTVNGVTTTTIVPSTPDAYVITDLAFINVNGSVYLYSGDSNGSISKVETGISTSSGPKQLNWRDVPLAN